MTAQHRITHSKATVVSMAVIATAIATLLHEGLGHGVVAWLRGDGVTELTSNHLSTVRADHWVEAGGTLVNLFVGSVALWCSRAAGDRANLRYFLWIFGAANLLPGAGYFLFSGVLGVGDWEAVISGLPYQAALRIAMSVFGLWLYLLVVRKLAVAVRPFVPDEAAYNVVGRYAYYAACIFDCAAGALDPLGLKLFFLSTVPAAFGGLSGLMFADSRLPKERAARELMVERQPAWWFAAGVIGIAYIAILGRGIRFG
jgi:hypothetical protein